MSTITGPMRARHATLLRELASWALERGRPANLDFAALLVELLTMEHGPFPWRLDRPNIEDAVHGLRDEGDLVANLALPDDRIRQLFDLVCFLSETERIDRAHVPLEVLLEPIRCGARLGPTGELRTPGEDEVRCQCLLPHDPTLPIGAQQHYVGSGHEGRRLVAVGTVLPPSEDYPVSRLEPLHEFLRQLRAEGSPWGLFAEELRYVGEVFATKDAPALSAYRLVDDRRGGRAPLLLDRTGQPWAIKAHRGRKLGYRWVKLTRSGAIYRAGIDDHILRARPKPPTIGWPA
jgi:hypothetical protein